MSSTQAEPASRVPSSLAQVGVTMKYTFLDYFRSRRFFILLAIVLLISALLTVLVGYYRPASFLSSGDLSFYSSWWGSSAVFLVALIGIFFGGDAISGEFQNKTGYFSLPHPIRRSSVYAGKWLAAFLASSIILVVVTAVTFGNGVYYFGLSLPYQFGEAVLFTWFYLVAVLGSTFFFSSLYKTSSYAIHGTAVLFLFAFNLIQLLVSNFAQVEPWFILTYGSQIIGNVLSTQYPAHITKAPFGDRGATITLYSATIPEGLAIIAAYFIITAILGLVFFERKEFT